MMHACIKYISQVWCSFYITWHIWHILIEICWNMKHWILRYICNINMYYIYIDRIIYMIFRLGIHVPDMSIAMSCSRFHGFSLFSIPLLAHHGEGGKTNCRKGGSSKGGGVDGVQVAYTSEENNSSWHCGGEGFLVLHYTVDIKNTKGWQGQKKWGLRKICMCASLDACSVRSYMVAPFSWWGGCRFCGFLWVMWQRKRGFNFSSKCIRELESYLHKRPGFCNFCKRIL